jgi:hypothetical protein
MFALPDRLVEAPARQRRNTQGSTGLDYSTCHRVEDDIFTRIRSLFTPQRSHLPSFTPSPSEKTSARITDYDIEDMFDFTTAKSVAHLARQASGRLSTSDIKVYEPVEGSIIKLSKRWTLRSSSSMSDLQSSDRLRSLGITNEMEQVLDDVAIHDTSLTCCPPRPPVKKGIELPRLVLRNKDSSIEKAKVLAGPKTAVETVVRRFDETCTQEAELVCASQCSIDERNEFTPDNPNLNWNSTEVSKSQCDFRAIGPTIPNPRFGLKDAIDSPEPISQGTSCPYEGPAGPPSRSRSLHLLSISGPGILSDASELSKMRGNISLHLPPQGSSTSMMGQADTPDSKDFPPGAGVSEMSLHHPNAAVETKPNRPSLASGPWSSSNSLSRASVHTSLLSGASRSSASRHALLKPSVTISHPVDLGLPVQPILTPLIVNKEAEASQDTNTAANDGHKPALPPHFPSTVTLPQSPTSKGATPRNTAQHNPLLGYGSYIATKGEYNDNFLDEFDICIGNTVAPLLHTSGATDGIASNAADGDPRGETVMEKTRGTDSIIKGSTPLEDTPPVSAMVRIDPNLERNALHEPTTSINGAHWGFTPPISEVADVASHSVVGEAARDLVIPSSLQSDQESATYRGAVKETLADAARTCDEYLKQSSSRSSYSTPSQQSITDNHASVDPQPSLEKTWPIGNRTPVSNLVSEKMEAPLRVPSVNEDTAGSRSWDLEKETCRSISGSSSNMNRRPTDPGELARRDSLFDMANVALSHPVHADAVQRKYSESDQLVWRSTHQGEVLCSGKSPSKCGAVPSQNASLCKVSLSNHCPKRLEGRLASVKDTDSAAPLEQSSQRATDKVGQQPNLTHSEGSTSTAMSPKADTPNESATTSDPKPAEPNRTKPAEINKSDRQRAVQWLQGLISNEPYTPRLTALPSRPQLGLESRIMTGEAPHALCKPADQVCFDSVPSPKQNSRKLRYCKRQKLSPKLSMILRIC